MEFQDVIRAAVANRASRGFPGAGDTRIKSGLLFPVLQPKFLVNFEGGNSVFTIGSCFARHIEMVLETHGVRMPTMDFAVPPSEWAARPNGLLNEYNPATISQRIDFALRGASYPETTIAPSGAGYTDLLLHGGTPVTLERAIERRREIDAVYAELLHSQILIVTLGLTEVWFDNETQLYLNQMPPVAYAAKHKGRFHFKRLDVSDSVPMLETALATLIGRNPELKILLTVSPVPLQTSFSDQDAIVANEYSKAVLRVTAHRLSGHPYVDYFPSYEIVRSGGLSSYIEDYVHVKPEVVEPILAYMLKAYSKAEDQSQ